jgi:hypothetical protein
MTSEEESALVNLIKDESIVIRPADKGSGVVVMDRDEYVRRMEEDLSSSRTYENVGQDLTEKIYNKLKRKVEKLVKYEELPKEMKQYLVPRDVAPGKAQGNPKIHKKR